MVCLSGVRYIPRVFIIPKFKRSLQIAVLRHELEKRMPVPLDQLHVSWRRLTWDGSGERYFVVGVPRRSVKSLVETMTQAGIKNYGLDVKPIALARSVNARESVILNLEQDNADVVLIADGIPEIMRSLPVDRDPDALADTLEDIGVEVIRTIDYYNSNHLDRPMNPEAPIFLTGGLAENQSATMPLHQLFGSRIASITTLIDCPNDFPAASYAANLGLALGRDNSKKTEALAPALAVGIEEREYRPPSHSARNLLLAGVAVLALTLLFPVYQARDQAHFNTSALAQELAVVESDLKNGLAANAPTESLRLEAGLLTDERKLVLGNQSRFAESISQLLSSLPNGIVPESMTMTSDTLIFDGQAINLPQVIALADQLEKLDLFSEVYLESTSYSDANESGNGTDFRIWAAY